MRPFKPPRPMRVLDSVRLQMMRPEERRRFSELAEQFPSVLEELQAGQPSASIDPEWVRYDQGIVQTLWPRPKFNFLHQPPLAPNIYWHSRDPLISSELAGLEHRIDATGRSRRALLQENAVGRPVVFDRRYLTSSILVHHLYTAFYFADTTGLPLDRVQSVVEWGGGYGSLARVLYRVQPSLAYVMLDTPVMLAVQWLYLSTVLGRERLLLDPKNTMTPTPGKVLLRYAGTYEARGFRPDVFVSTFGLSESPASLIARVASQNWFEAVHLWLEYTPSNPRFPQWSDLEKAAISSGARTLPHPLRPVDRFALR